MVKLFARHGYVRMCYLNWIYTVTDWKFRIRAARGRQLCLRASLHCMKADMDERSINRTEACEILWNKFEELGGQR